MVEQTELSTKYITRREELYTSGLQIVNLYAAPKRDIDDLSQRVSKHNGKVQIMVHPFYGLFYGEGFERYASRRDRFLTSCVENQVPMIVFEEKRGIRLFQERISADLGKLYFVETQLGTSEPRDSRGIQPLTDLFRNMGVKHVVVGGMYTHIFPNEKITLKAPGVSKWASAAQALGCAGLAAARFKREGFKVSISGISFPHYLKGSSVDHSSMNSA